MKRFAQILLIGILLFSLVGCGNKDSKNNSTKDKNNNDYSDNGSKINDDTKVGTISVSYRKFTELKTEIYDKLNAEISDSQNYNFSLSMGLLGFATIDLSMIPLTFCGEDKEAALIGLSFLYSNTTYESTDNNCKISFTTDAGKVSYDSIYDKKSDSLQTKMYENDKLTAISEYVKLDNGYATQFYTDDGDEASVYKAIFDQKRIIVGMQNQTGIPESIYKNSSIATEDWTKSQELWSKYEDGKVVSIIEGKEF